MPKLSKRTHGHGWKTIAWAWSRINWPTSLTSWVNHSLISLRRTLLVTKSQGMVTAISRTCRTCEPSLTIPLAAPPKSTHLALWPACSTGKTSKVMCAWLPRRTSKRMKESLLIVSIPGKAYHGSEARSNRSGKMLVRVTTAGSTYHFWTANLAQDSPRKKR